MNPIQKNGLAILSGAILGSIVNMLIILMSSSIIQPPEGADTTTIEGLKESMHLFHPQHFVFPFLAHAIGTLVGALIAVKIAASYKLVIAMLVSTLFLIGGIINIIQLPSPMWFSVLDIVVAYIPMGLLAKKLLK